MTHNEDTYNSAQAKYENIAVRRLVRQYMADERTLSKIWDSLDQNQRTIITTVAKELYPDDLDQQQATTRALIMSKALVPEEIQKEVAWTERFKVFYEN